MAEMPQSVRNSLADKVDTLSFHELAKAAKAYFNQDGSLRAANTQVNLVEPNGVNPSQTFAPTPSNASTASTFTLPFEDHSAPHGEVNAIGRRSNSSNSGNSDNRQTSQLRNPSSQRRGSANRSLNRPNTNRDPSRNPNWCWAHNKFGNDARNCKPPCSFSNNNSAQSGNSRGGRR